MNDGIIGKGRIGIGSMYFPMAGALVFLVIVWSGAGDGLPGPAAKMGKSATRGEKILLFRNKKPVTAEFFLRLQFPRTARA